MHPYSAIREIHRAVSAIPHSGALLCSFAFYKAFAIIVCAESFLALQAQGGELFAGGWQVVFFLISAAVCVGIAVFLRKSISLFAQDWYVWLMLLLILFGLLLLFLRVNANAQEKFSESLCLYLGMIFLAVGFMGIHIEYGRILGSLGMTKTLVLGIVCSCIGGVLYLIASLVSELSSWIMISLYAVAAVVLFDRSRRALGKEIIYDCKFEKDLKVPYRFMLTSLMQGLSFGFLSGVSVFSGDVYSSGIWIIGLAGSALLAMFTVLVIHVDFNRAIYQIGFPLLAFGMLCMNFAPMSASVAIACQVIAFLYIDLVLWALGSYLIKDRNQPSTWVAACPTAMLMTGRAMGLIVGGFLEGETKQIAFFVSAFAIVFVCLLLSSEHNIKTGWGFIRPGDSRLEADTGMICEAVAKEHLLTERESEVLKLLAQVKDAQDIADDMGISPNTVKSHIQNIYNKLNVHSRKELLRIVENRRKFLRSD